MFIPAHDAVVFYAREANQTPNFPEIDGGPELVYPSETPVLLGYTNLPQTARGLNNSKGFALGQRGAAYNKRGRIEPTATVEIRPGSLGAIQDLIPDSTGVLPYITLFVSVKGADADSSYTDIYRYCKPTTLDWKLGGGGDKGGGEISISAALWATAYQRKDGSIAIPTNDLRALGTPLMWHDVRQFTITSNSNQVLSYRQAVMNLSVKVDYGLERKNERPNWGDDNPLSRTSYALLEHHTNVSGELGLHSRLPSALFSGAANAQNWGNIHINCSDVGGHGFTLDLVGAFPSDETQGGGESSAEIDHTVPFTADTLTVSRIP